MEIFKKNLYLLKELFGEDEVNAKIERLEFIYENTEKSWLTNLKYFNGKEVKFILICEAPPYSESEIPVYFYNQISKNFHAKIWKVFFNEEKMPDSFEEILQRLANKGFLLIDNIPFALKYASHQRKKAAYKEILKKSLQWTINKLSTEKINFADNTKVAFGFKLNALSFIEITRGQLKLNNLVLNFDESNICADGSGYPSSSKLSEIYFLAKNSEFSQYNYYKGEKENPYHKKDSFELDFQNPKSLFWFYENHFHLSNQNEAEFSSYMENLIHNKLSEYIRSDFNLWKMYFENSIK